MAALFADESDTEDDVNVGAADAGLVDTSNIPSSSKAAVPRSRTKQTARMTTGGRHVPPSSKQAAPSGKQPPASSSGQVNPQVAQTFRLDKQDLKQIEEMVASKLQVALQKRVQEEKRMMVSADQCAMWFGTAR